MYFFDEIYSNLREGESINNYIDELLRKIATKYSKSISFKEWINNKWLDYKKNVENNCRAIYTIENGYWDKMLLDIEHYINNWLIIPNWLDLSIDLREFIDILHKYNKIEYLKLKNNKSNKDKKSLRNLNKKISIPEYLRILNEYFLPCNNKINIDYYDNNFRELKKLKTFLSKPLHAYSIFYNNKFNNSK